MANKLVKKYLTSLVIMKMPFKLKQTSLASMAVTDSSESACGTPRALARRWHERKLLKRLRKTNPNNLPKLNARSGGPARLRGAGHDVSLGLDASGRGMFHFLKKLTSARL